jgi:hypothetical protein
MADRKPKTGGMPTLNFRFVQRDGWPLRLQQQWLTFTATDTVADWRFVPIVPAEPEDET